MPDEPTSPSPKADPGLQGLDPGELLARGLHTVKPSASNGPWEPPTPEELAKLLPQYRVEALLGRGGMGAVYKGTQVALDRPVAIKLLPAELATDADFVARFQREARTLAKLQHSGIVTVYDFGQTSEGHLYFVMEFVDGTDLQRILKGPGLKPEQAFEMIAQICDALYYAHRQGVVHRDIKPANILLTLDGRSKVADFGLARPLSEDGGGLTRTNMIMGTPDYMAPETRTGVSNGDHRADIFALGVMLYEMLTGQRPHGAFQPPSQKVQVDVRIDEVVLKALQQEPDRRYQQASEMKVDVDRIRTTPPTPAKPKRSKVLVAASVILGLLFLGLAIPFVLSILAHQTQRKPADSARAEASGTEAQPASQTALPNSALSNGTPGTATKDPPFSNSLGMKFVPVPGTDILMCIHETRRKDYAAYADAIPGVDATWKNPMDEGKLLVQGDDHPVVEVSWQDATGFCAWLSKKEGRTYRLPTEREWNLAAAFDVNDPRTISDTDLKAILKPQYPWGTRDQKDAQQYGNYKEESDGYKGTAPVMSFLPNHLGIYDLGGNAWEWCEGWFDDEQSKRVLRGCGYLNYGPYRVSGTREARDPGYRSPTRNLIPGFRCVLETAPSERAAKVDEQKPAAARWEVPQGHAVPQNSLWQKAVWADKDLPNVSADGWLSVGAEMRTAPPNSVSGQVKTPVNFGDGAVRAQVRFGTFPPGIISFWLRMPYEQSIQFVISQSELRATRNGDKGVEMGRIAFDTPFRPGEVERFEAAAVGDTFIARFKGKELRFQCPEAKRSGSITIHGRSYAVKDVEYAILDGIPDPLKALGWEVPEQVTQATPVPTSTVLPVVPATVLAARENGGKLRVFGQSAVGEVPLGQAKDFADFCELAISRDGWMARRANGDAWCIAGVGQTKFPPKEFGPFPSSGVQHSRYPYLRLSADGSFRNIFGGTSQHRPDLAHPDSVAFLNAYDHTVVLAKDGTMIFNQNWHGKNKEGRISPPDDFFLGATAYAATADNYVSARPDLPVRSWSVAKGTLTDFSKEIRNIVETDASGRHVILRAASGAVFVTTPDGKAYSICRVPADLGLAIAVRAGEQMCAAQMTDGTWRAWGSSPELIEQTKKIGAAIDVDFYSDGPGKPGFMMWIDPLDGESPEAAAVPPLPPSSLQVP